MRVEERAAAYSIIRQLEESANWELRPLVEVADILDSKRIPINSKEREARVGDVPYYGATGQVGWIDDYLFDEELVLLGEDGAPFLDPSKPKAYLVRGKSWVNNHAHVLRGREVPNAWLAYYLNSIHYDGLVSGTTRLKLTQAAMRQIMVPVTSMPAMGRIVAEIEKQFSRLDEAVANLKRVKANIKRYKTAVLKAAVEGRLVETEAELARREGRSFETGAQLLHRILETRRKQWVGKGKYKEPSAPDIANLPELPNGWVYATAEQLTDENRAITYGVIKLGESVDGGVPVLRSSDVRHLRIDLDEVKCISPEIAENYRRTFLKGGEVVMTVRGTLGGIAVVPSQCNGFNVSREVAMLALVDPQMAQLVALFVASAPLENWLMRHAKGIAYTGINIETLKALPIPVPPIAEHKRIVAEVERRLSLLHETEAQVNANLQRAERLRRTILASAFNTTARRT